MFYRALNPLVLVMLLCPLSRGKQCWLFGKGTLVHFGGPWPSWTSSNASLLLVRERWSVRSTGSDVSLYRFAVPWSSLCIIGVRSLLHPIVFRSWPWKEGAVRCRVELETSGTPSASRWLLDHMTFMWNHWMFSKTHRLCRPLSWSCLMTSFGFQLQKPLLHKIHFMNVHVRACYSRKPNGL